MNDNLHPWIEPELEARIVALVLGESSDFEREELERLCDERREVAMVRKQMEDLHELLRESTPGDGPDVSGEWKLPSAKKEHLFASMEKAEALPVEVVPASKARGEQSGNGKSERARRWILAMGVAACLALFFSILAFPAMNELASEARPKSDGYYRSREWFAETGNAPPAVVTTAPTTVSERDSYLYEYTPADKEIRRKTVARSRRGIRGLAGYPR